MQSMMVLLIISIHLTELINSQTIFRSPSKRSVLLIEEAGVIALESGVRTGKWRHSQTVHRLNQGITETQTV